MTVQKFFNYNLSEKKDKDNFFVNSSNRYVYNILVEKKNDQNIFLYGPKKSGKSHLLNIWKDNYNALMFHKNFNEIISSKKNVAIDDIFNSKSEEEIFHIINHCNLFNLKILITSSIKLQDYNSTFLDLFSRLRTFFYLEINEPNDEMCKILMTKLFYEKQIIVKNKEIFDFILNRVNRTYNDIFLLVDKIDKLSLEKKRQLTIPLIKEIL